MTIGDDCEARTMAAGPWGTIWASLSTEPWFLLDKVLQKMEGGGGLGAPVSYSGSPHQDAPAHKRVTNSIGSSV